MEDFLGSSFSLQDVVNWYHNPWAWVITWVVYCLTIGTLQCRSIARYYKKRNTMYRADELGNLFCAQIFAPFVTVGLIVIWIVELIGFTLNKIYFKE